MKELLNKTIKKIFISDDSIYLKFETNDGEFVYEAVGDCCSQSWFHEIIGVDCLLNATVNNIEDCELNRLVDEYSDVIEIYCHKFKTNKGYCDIIYRNSSNGYYGGWTELYTYTQKYITYKEITDDWISRG